MITNFFNKLNLFLNYRKVGSDAYGNQYYEAKKFDKNLGLFRRVVHYKGMPEPSKVPEIWHGWLYHILKDVPTKEQLTRYSWQKDHEPNFTGTEEAYFPEGHVMRNAVRVPISNDYHKWKPKS